MVERFLVGDRATWLERRRRAVNASEVGALFDCHTYQTRLGLYSEKFGKKFERKIDEVTFRRGRIFENAVAAAVQEERPDWKIEKAKHWLFDPLRSVVLDGTSVTVGIGATPDFIVQCPRRGRGLLQTKTAIPAAFDADWTPEMPPLWIALQVQQEMMLEGVSWGAIAVLVVDPWAWPVHIYELDAHAETQGLLRTKANDFWAAVDAGIEPAADYDKDADLLKRMYPADNGEILDLSASNHMAELIGRYEDLKARIKTYAPDEKELKAVETEIKAKLGNALGARGNGWEVRSPTIARKGYVVEDTTYRTLKIKRTA